jgi:subtilisin family serine protease
VIGDELPAWSLDAAEARTAVVPSSWPRAVDRAWAFGDGSGAGVRVAIIDSGIDPTHPVVGGRLARSVSVAVDGAGNATVDDDDAVDLSGHGTACAGIICALAPACELTSVRVLGTDLTGAGDALIAGVRWAVRERHDIVNLSLSTTKAKFADALRELVDEAYFNRCLIVASAHNMPIASWPWRFAAVLSVASHSEPDSEVFFHNPQPPVEFHARGIDVEVGWTAGSTIRASGNSFATPHMAGMAARVLGAHPGLRPFEVKTALHLSADNVKGDG